MIYTILLIYLILICFFFYVKIKKNVNLVIYNKKFLFFEIIKIVSFVFFYVVYLRILNLFRISQILDLKVLNYSYNLILLFIFIFSFRKLVFFIFKISWFKFHYVMMCEDVFSEKVNEKYKYFFYKIIYIPACIFFKYFVYINYLMFLILILIFFYDLIFNNFVLNYSLYYLKYYSLFKIIYYGHCFMMKKQNLVLDYYSYSLMYQGNPEESFFASFCDEQHKKLKIESKKYLNGIVLEKHEYNPKPLGNTAEMPYFKNLKK